MNSTSPMFTFTPSDGIFVVLQFLTYFLFATFVILLCLFRKEKELKYRGALPYVFIFGLIILSCRFIINNMSFLQTTNNTSFTYRFSINNSLFSFSCWYGLISTAPVLMFFLEVNTLSIFQYLVNKRILVLKNMTFDLIDLKQSGDKKLEKEIELKENLTTTESTNQEEADLQKDSNGSKPSSTSISDESLAQMRSIFRKLKISKFFLSKWFMMFFIIGTYFFIILFHLLIHGGIEIFTPTICTLDQYPLAFSISSFITPVIWAIFLFINFILMSIDFIFFLRENKFNWKFLYTFYFVDDPYGFRIEQLIVFLALISLYWVSFIPIITFAINQFSTAAPFTSLRGQIVGSIQSVLLIVLEIFLLFALSSIGLFLSIISSIKRRFQPKIYDSEFDAFINSNKGKEIFKKFSKSEWSPENLEFYSQVEKYVKIKNLKHAEKRANEIVKNYVKDGAPLEVNLSGPVRKGVVERVKNFKELKDKVKIFDDAMVETKRNMRDTFGRLRRTLAFQEWSKSSKSIVE
jgi:hypothetical protein